MLPLSLRLLSSVDVLYIPQMLHLPLNQLLRCLSTSPRIAVVCGILLGSTATSKGNPVFTG